MIAAVGISSTLKFRGGAAAIFSCRDHEVILDGPYQTGKTYAKLTKLNAQLIKYPNSQALMVRKTYKSLLSSVVVTFEKKIHGGKIGDERYPIKKFGGERPDFYQYPNGSRLWLGGMDNADKFLSAEFDFIYVNQAEEISLDDWEKLMGRASGRAGNAPYPQIMGDCNPDTPQHWIVNRESITLFKTKHEDNPTLFDDDGKMTEQGKVSMSILDSLTGLRHKRGRLGLWVGAEGQVYEFDPNIHLLTNFEPPKHWRRFRSIDFGYRNAFVCQWWALDNDDRLYLYREIYMTGRLVEDHAITINEYSQGETIYATIADHDAEDAATLARYGIDTIPAFKAVKRGIEAVESRLRVAPDGKPRLFIVADCTIEIDDSLRQFFKPTSTQSEFAGYVWDPRGKEQPIKVGDHGMDAMRYMVAFVDSLVDDTAAGIDEMYDIFEPQVISSW